MTIARVLQSPLVSYHERLNRTFSPIQASSCLDHLREISIRVALVAVVIFAEVFLGIPWGIGKCFTYCNDLKKEISDQRVSLEQSQKLKQGPLDQRAPATNDKALQNPPPMLGLLETPLGLHADIETRNEIVKTFLKA